jgi:hypothetical protein
LVIGVPRFLVYFLPREPIIVLSASIGRLQMQLEQEPQVESLFTPELERELWKHPGEWIAIVDQQILVTADSLPGLIQKARDAGHREPLIYKVPDKDNSYFF